MTFQLWSKVQTFIMTTLDKAGEEKMKNFQLSAFLRYDPHVVRGEHLQR